MRRGKAVAIRKDGRFLCLCGGNGTERRRDQKDPAAHCCGCARIFSSGDRDITSAHRATLGSNKVSDCNRISDHPATVPLDLLQDEIHKIDVGSWPDSSLLIQQERMIFEAETEHVHLTVWLTGIRDQSLQRRHSGTLGGGRRPEDTPIHQPFVEAEPPPRKSRGATRETQISVPGNERV